MEKGEVLKAIKILEQLRSQYPDKPQILESLAFAFIESKDFFTGAFYFNELAQAKPENNDYYLYSAQAWVNAGDLDSAIQDYEAYLLENRSDWNTWQKIGELYLQTDQKSKAIHAYSNSSQIRFNPQLDLKAALLANESGNLREAEAGFERLLLVEDSAVSQQAHVGLIQIKHKRRQWDEVENLMKEIEIRFPRALSSPEIKEVRDDFQSFNEARIAEAETIKMEEERRQRLIDQQRERAEQMEAARLASTQQSEDPQEVPPSELAINEDDEGPSTTVEPAKLPVIEVPQPKSPFEETLEEARKIASTNSDEAVTSYWDAINLGDDSGVAFYELSRLYYNRNQFDEAEMTSLEALRRGPDNNRYLMTYLHIIRKNKAKPEVISEIRKYRKAYPKNPDLVLLLARIYAEPSGDVAAARSLYDLFFQMAPNHPDLDRAKYEAQGI